MSNIFSEDEEEIRKIILSLTQIDSNSLDTLEHTLTVYNREYRTVHRISPKTSAITRPAVIKTSIGNPGVAHTSP